MKYAHLFSFLIIPHLLYAQSETIHWQYKTSWNEIIKSALTEKKDVFIDCFATWCGPCKWMDKNVFNKEDVANFTNSHFISIKLQFDSTETDDTNTIKERLLSKFIFGKYNIKGLPTYLFFNTKGEIIEQKTGEKPDTDFISILNNVYSRKENYYNLINNVNNNTIDSTSTLFLIQEAEKRKDFNTANIATRYFLDRYENIMCNNKDLITQLQDILPYALNPSDTLFKVAFQSPNQLDRITHDPNYSENLVINVIVRDNFPFLDGNKISLNYLPDWGGYFSLLRNKYGSHYANKVILSAQINFYKKSHDNINLAKAYVINIEQSRIDTSQLGMLFTNNVLYSIVFKYSMDENVLNSSAHIMTYILSRGFDPDYIDTYSNLIYKSGHRTKAIQWEKKAAALSPDDKSIQTTLLKMYHRQPTW
jgi:thioredoxin-related protein